MSQQYHEGEAVELPIGRPIHSLLEDLDRRRERVWQANENRARMASAFARFDTTGLGTLHHPDRIDFGLIFIEEPYIQSSNQVDLYDYADQLGLDIDTDDLPLPVCTVFVNDWDQDDRDMYIGAWVSVRVHLPETLLEEGTTGAVSPAVQPDITHHVTFTAIAMKDVPLDLSDEVNG